MAFERNENLAGALRASLRVIDRDSQVPPKAIQSTDGEASDPIAPSPLTEVDASSLDLELDRLNDAVNGNLIAGLPEAITDETLTALVDLYRAKALQWEMEESTKKPRAKSGPRKSHVEAMEL
jgi:hypothetical protein